LGRRRSKPAARAAAIAPYDDGAVLAQSARASKLIGSKVNQGDTSIGQIEDVLVELDHAIVPAVIPPASRRP
jgi:hypothetical protein